MQNEYITIVADDVSDIEEITIQLLQFINAGTCSCNKRKDARGNALEESVNKFETPQSL